MVMNSIQSGACSHHSLRRLGCVSKCGERVEKGAQSMKLLYYGNGFLESLEVLPENRLIRNLTVSML